MKVEKDPFRYKIKDAKQLALKVTANSLYGQLGAPTSPVFLKAIAGSYNIQNFDTATWLLVF